MFLNILMDIPGFVRCYVSNALEIMRNSEKVPLSDFERVLFERVSSEMDIEVVSVKRMHHPFHWVFFCKTFSLNSPFELYSESSPGSEILYARRRRDYGANETDEICKIILEEHGALFEARIKNLSLAHS